MIQDFSQHDLMRFEFFEHLLPHLIYTGTPKQQDEILGYLREDGMNFIQEMIAVMCNQDQIEYPYKDTDFFVERLERGGAELIRMDLPAYSKQHNDIIRAYLVTIKAPDGKLIKKYYTIRYFVEGPVCIMYVDADGEIWVNEKLDMDRFGDMEYEYWRVANCFVWKSVDELIKKKDY